MTDLVGLKILLVDDQPDMLDLALFILDSQGAEVIAVSSAIEALSLLETTRPDVLISDIGMPEIDGYTLMKQVKQRNLDIPAIALTAYAGEVNHAKSLAAGFQKHLAKPVEANQLIEAITILMKDS
jgi:CheY-like chemotaxis protein